MFIKKYIYKIETGISKCLAFCMLAGMGFSCKKKYDTQPVRQYQHAEIMLDFRDLPTFQDDARREIVNKNNRVVLYRLTEQSKKDAFYNITVDQWENTIKPAIQQMQLLAEKQNVKFKGQGDIRFKNAHRSSQEVDSVGTACADFLRFCGFGVYEEVR